MKKILFLFGLITANFAFLSCETTDDELRSEHSDQPWNQRVEGHEGGFLKVLNRE